MEVDDDNFNEIVKNEKHNETINSLGAIVKAITKKEEETSNMLNSLKEEYDKIAIYLSNIEKNLKSDSDIKPYNIGEDIKILGESLQQAIEKINIKPQIQKEIVFTIDTDSRTGIIKQIIAKPK